MRNFFRKSSKGTAETARRVTGISTPVFGVSWSDPGPSETEIVRRFLVFLEDRRVLYNPFDSGDRGRGGSFDPPDTRGRHQDSSSAFRRRVRRRASSRDP